MTAISEERVQAAVVAAETPLADMTPVELVEIEDDGQELPQSWGKNGAGEDTEPDSGAASGEAG